VILTCPGPGSRVSARITVKSPPGSDHVGDTRRRAAAIVHPEVPPREGESACRRPVAEEVMWDQVGRLYAHHADVPAELRLLKLTEEVAEGPRRSSACTG
jgi:hypothetical protein